MSIVLLEQYIREALTEAASIPQRLYHGSSRELKPGSVLGGRPFKSQFGSMEDILEHYRPEEMHGRLNSVYMTSRPSDVDRAGGSEAYIYLVEPLDEVQRHHQGWIDVLYELAQEKSDNYTKRGPILHKKTLRGVLESGDAEKAALGYWNGRPPPSEYRGSVWEYLCGQARVVKEVKISW